ncbi:hypothetical protein [Pseudooceanicola sp.]|uniref:hypothetical protein n=1 Tax=Pseudooceanicola sp. TaxID=1914328 RepID=UPI0035C676BA
MKTLMITAGLGLFAMAAPAAADAKLFPYPASANYCPQGLQPVQMGGVICCGVPNQSVTYSQYQAHPTRRVYRAPYDGSKSPQGWDGSKSPQG